MGWDAHLTIDNVSWAGLDWNYTHNTSRMIYDILEKAGIELGVIEGRICKRPGPDGTWIESPLPESWWNRLNGMSGSEGCQFLTIIVDGLEKDPDFYRAMNPENGWGNYEGILQTLTEMRDACTSEIPMTWEASG